MAGSDNNRHNTQIRQFIRYIAVGVMNTLVTLAVIYVCKSFTPIPLMVCNAIGYITGLVNSFLWNRAWVFRARTKRSGRQILHFAAGFGVAYALQFLFVWGMMKWPEFASILVEVGPFTISGYGISTIFGMGLYTVANFLYNRKITFR